MVTTIADKRRALNKFKIDDPVGTVFVHGVNGVWGIIALGLFADGAYGDGLNGFAGNVE